MYYRVKQTVDAHYSRVRLWSSRVESRTVLPMVINTFKPKYAVQRYLGLH